MGQTKYQELFERYKLMSEKELKEIISSDEYDYEAKRIAQEILNSDRIEYYNTQEEQKRAELINEKKNAARETDPLYDDIHQIAGDLRFIKNFIIISVIVFLAVTLIGFLLSR